MKNLRNIFFLSAIVIAAAAVSAGGVLAQGQKPLTLRECYRGALMQGELIAVDAERIRQAQARFTQAFGVVMPHVSFSRADARYDSESSGKRSYEQGFVFTQELFAGFKHYAAISAGRFEKKQRQSEFLRAQQLLFTDVADAFYLLMEAREDLKILETVKGSFVERVTELKKREELGKSRRSEVVSTETQLYTLQDQIEAAVAREGIARELLEFLTGGPVGELTETATVYALEPEERYAAGAALRPDVKASEYAWEIAKRQVTIARSGFWPTVTAEGDYFTHRSSAPKDSDWQALLKVSVPIFEGTTTIGQVQEANSVARQNELLARRAARSASSEIHTAYINARYAFLRTAVLDKAAKSAELNYSLQEKDYRLNVVNNLDVLTALQSYQEVRRSYIHMYYEGRRFFWQLKAAAGQIEVEEK